MEQTEVVEESVKERQEKRGELWQMDWELSENEEETRGYVEEDREGEGEGVERMVKEMENNEESEGSATSVYWLLLI